MSSSNTDTCLKLERLETDGVTEADRIHALGCAGCAQLLREWEEDQRLLATLRKLTPETAPGLDAGKEGDEGWPAIPGYTLIREIHRGGQGLVVEAFQNATRRRVAIKLMLGGPLAGEKAHRRFQREMELTASLRHRHVVTIFDGGEVFGWHYYVMDLIEGRPLTEYALTRHLTRQELLRLFEKTASGVAAAHAMGIVHRDLKPSNVLVDEAGEPFILDFGIAKGFPASALHVTTLTAEAHPLGTPIYMAPEQAAGQNKAVGPWTDVHALGVMLYQCACGRLPYRLEGSSDQVSKTIVDTPPVPPRRAARRNGAPIGPVDGALEAVLLKSLAKNPAERYADAEEFRQDLSRCLRGEPVRGAWRTRLAPYLQHLRWRLSTHKRWSAAALLAAICFLAFEIPYLMGLMGSNPENWVIAPSGPRIERLDRVKMIGVGSSDEMIELANDIGLQGVTQSSLTWRGLHGALMSHLAHSGCRAIVWDLFFEKPSPFDEAFAEGVRDLRQKEIDVVIGVRGFRPADGTMPGRDIAPEIAHAGVRVGSIAILPNPEKDHTVSAYLFAQRGGNAPYPHLALAALAAFQMPGRNVELTPEYSDAREAVNLRFYEDSQATFSEKKYVMPPGMNASDGLVLDLSWVRRVNGRFIEPGAGVELGDLVGGYEFHLPPKSAFKEACFGYHEVFQAGEPRLRELFEGRVIMIGDHRPGVDEDDFGDYGLIPRSYYHQACLENLIAAAQRAQPQVSAPRRLQLLLFSMASTLLGAWAGVKLRKNVWMRGLLLAGILGLVLLPALVASRQGYIIPLPAMIFGVVVASEAFALLGRWLQPLFPGEMEKSLP